MIELEPQLEGVAPSPFAAISSQAFGLQPLHRLSSSSVDGLDGSITPFSAVTNLSTSFAFSPINASQAPDSMSLSEKSSVAECFHTIKLRESTTTLQEIALTASSSTSGSGWFLVFDVWPLGSIDSQALLQAIARAAQETLCEYLAETMFSSRSLMLKQFGSRILRPSINLTQRFSSLPLNVTFTIT
jgi:hypothetical protein